MHPNEDSFLRHLLRCISQQHVVCVERKGRATSSSANNGSHPDTPVKGERNIDFFVPPCVHADTCSTFFVKGRSFPPIFGKSRLFVVRWDYH